ncbi:MAG: hypothetical protein ACKVH8_17830 [Pirellulales bacterium]
MQYTSYLAITGEHTAWPGERPLKFSEMTADYSNTVLVTEFEEKPIPWLKPEDIELTDALEIISTNDPTQSELNHPGGRQTLQGDGSVQFRENRLTKETWRKLIQIDQAVEDDDYQYLPEPVISPITHYNLILRAIIFVVLVFLPLVWIGQRNKIPS